MVGGLRRREPLTSVIDSRVTFGDGNLHLWLVATWSEELRARCPRRWADRNPRTTTRTSSPSAYQQGERDLDTLDRRFGRRSSAIRSRPTEFGREGLA